MRYALCKFVWPQCNQYNAYDVYDHCPVIRNTLFLIQRYIGWTDPDIWTDTHTKAEMLAVLDQIIANNYGPPPVPDTEKTDD